jgi:hypothetical protein
VGSTPTDGTMKIQVQAKDLLNAIQGMDPDAVVFEYTVSAKELVEHIKNRQLSNWAEQVRQKIQEAGVEAFFQTQEGHTAPVLEA